ncbi:MAG: VIT domain-containing protein, partial [Planctomycetota bacterium]
MSRPPVTLLLLAVLSISWSVLAPPPARANGILVTDGTVVGATPPIVDRHRPRPPRPPRHPVRLKDHRVHATLKGRVADVQVEQVFHNDSGRQLEGTYLFPLPEGASVARFAMTMGGKMVEGEILEAKQARRIYQDIVRRRRDPGLLEYVGRGLFRARVFPIEPRSDLTIRLRFQLVLPENDGTLEFRYPLATDRLNGQPVENVLVNVDIESDVDLKAVYCPSHDVAVVRKGNRRASVTYERAGRKQDRDFLLYVGRSPEDVGFSLVSHQAVGEDGTFLAVLAPSSDVPAAERQPKDVVYVLDVSGSMGEDDKIDQAKRALEYGVRTLHAGDRFAIIAFATGVRSFRDALVPVTGETKDAASRWIRGLRAAGGTNIEEALARALALQGSDRLRLVVFITDGKPTIGQTDPDRLLEQIRKENRAKARVFTFGVGYDLDVRLLDRIAEATKGSRDYVTPREDLEVVTSRFFRKVSEPVLSDVKISFGPGIHDVYPKDLPDLFAGGQIVVLGRYEKPGDRLIRLEGTLAGKRVVHEYSVTFAGRETASYLPRLWAHRKVAFLLDAIRLHGENKELIDEIVRLSTRYGIVTPYTAGLVVEESELASRPAGRRLARAALEEALRRRLRGALPLPPGPGPTGPAPAEAPAPDREVRDSSALDKLKKAGYAAGDEDDAGETGAARERVKALGGKTFLRDSSGRWVDTAYDGKQEPQRVEAFSDAWQTLLDSLEAKYGPKAAKFLSLGEKVVFVLGGKTYEVVPPAD